MKRFAVENHDYMWARMPFLVPMAAKIARTCCGTPGPACGRLAQLVDQLHSLALRHLDREERLLTRMSATRADHLVIDEIVELSAEHRQLLALLTQVYAMAGLPVALAQDACPTVHAFHEELRSLDRHLRDQILIEDEILRSHAASAAHRHDVEGRDVESPSVADTDNGHVADGCASGACEGKPT